MRGDLNMGNQIKMNNNIKARVAIFSSNFTVTSSSFFLNKNAMPIKYKRAKTFADKSIANDSCHANGCGWFLSKNSCISLTDKIKKQSIKNT